MQDARASEKFLKLRIPSWVPQVIKEKSEVLLSDSVIFDEKDPSFACQDCIYRLVTDIRMRAVYNSLDLPIKGMRIFFDIVWNHASLPEALRGKKADAYVLAERVESLAKSLAIKLQALEVATSDLGPPRYYNIDFDVFHNTLEWIRRAADDNANFKILIDPILTQISNAARTGGVPTPAKMLEKMAEHANELEHLRTLPGGEIQFAYRILDADGGGQSFAPASYYRSIASAFDMYPSTRPAMKLSHANFAKLMSVALNVNISSDAVEEIRARENV